MTERWIKELRGFWIARNAIDEIWMHHNCDGIPPDEQWLYPLQDCIRSGGWNLDSLIETAQAHLAECEMETR